MGSDAGFEGCAGYGGLISIHAPRMGSDQHPIKFRDMHVGFQSTLPGWGATNGTYSTFDDLFISIHAPRMGSDIIPCGFSYHGAISIHAPRMGSDPRYTQVWALAL